MKILKQKVWIEITVKVERDELVWCEVVTMYYRHYMLYLQEKNLLLISRTRFHVAQQVFSAFHPSNAEIEKRL